MKNNMDILIVGVGGQGSLLCSKILGVLFGARDFDVKVNEVHGMSQRGGSVVTAVRASKSIVAAPTVEPGSADLIIALEMLEGARYFPFLKKTGKFVTSSLVIYPPSLPIDARPPLDDLRPEGALSIDADALAAEAGNPRTANVVLLGAVSNLWDFSVEEWYAALESSVKSAHLEVNKQAFALGRQLTMDN